MKYLILLLAAISSATYADGFYTDIGIGVHSNYYDTSDHPDNKSTMYAPNPLGIIEMGYTYKSFTVVTSHISSIPDRYDNRLLGE